MYESYFGLVERPFSIAPDPQYLYMSDRHKEAMAHLSYGLSQGGCFIVLTGEVGTGKTTLCRNLISDLPDNVDLALILNANINEAELLQTVCDELKVDYSDQHSQKQLLDLINQHLLSTFANSRHTVLIIDEAQLLSRNVLEQVRLLTNLETTKHKLLQIVLIGQPELNDMLTRNDLRQLAQRVTARYHLGELKKAEIEEYVNFRLGVAGCKQPLFSSQALVKLHQLTDGIPRKINVLADHALLSTYSQNKRVVDASAIKESAKEVFFTSKSNVVESSSAKKWWALASALLILNAIFWWYFMAGSKTNSDVTSQLVAPNTSETVAIKSTLNRNDEPEGGSITEQVSQAQGVGLSDQEGVSVTTPVGDGALELGNELVSQPGVELDNELLLNSAVESVAGSAVELKDDSLAELNVNSNFELDPGLSANTDNQAIGITSDALQDSGVKGSVVVSEEYLDDESIDGAFSSNVSSQSDAAINSQRQVNQRLLEQTEFGRILETSADLTGRITAFRGLVQLWGVELPSRIFNSTCNEAQARGLQCIFFNGWDQFLRFNKPAVLVLNHENQLHRVIVEVVDGDAAEVRVGDSIYRISVEELKARWGNNDAVLIWRPSEAGSEFMQIGNRDLNLPVVRRYLNRALEQTQVSPLSAVNSAVFDRDLSQALYALQSTYGILPDSKLGNETYLLLNELVRPNTTPKLRNRLPQ